MERGDEGLCLLCCTHWSLSLDCDDWGVGCQGFCDSSVFLRTEASYMSLLVTLEAESALNPLLLFFIRECGLCPSMSDVHGVWVMIAECIPPLGFGSPSSSVGSLDSLLQENVFLLMCLCRSSPVVPCDWVVEFDAVGH